jgi:hypothetical protein
MINVNNRYDFLKEVKNKLPENPICCEIGVYQGGFSEVIYDILKPKKLYLIDPFENMVDPITNEEFYPELNWHRTVYSEGCLEHVNNLLSEGINNNTVIIDKNLSTNAVNNYEDGFFDFIYIDACHLYESAYWDIVNYFPKLKSGGIMSGHDYIDMPSFGVKRAVNEFCHNYNYEIEILDNLMGDWALTIKR